MNSYRSSFFVALFAGFLTAAGAQPVTDRDGVDRQYSRGAKEMARDHGRDRRHRLAPDVREKIEGMSPEERRDFFKKRRAEHLAKLPPEDREKIEGMSPEERREFFKQRRLQQLPADVRERIEKMTPDERRAYFRELKEKRRDILHKLSPEERERLQKMDPEQRREFFQSKSATAGA